MKSTARRNAALALCFGLSVAATSPSLWAVNSELDVKVGSSNLLAAASYVQNTLPNTASDITFTATAYAPVGFTVSGNNALSIGTLNDLGTPSLTISNGTASTVSTLTLNGGGDMVSGTSADLLYVALGSSLSIQNGSGTLNLTLAAAGNLDVAGTLSISSTVAMGSNAITKTGAGTLTINGTNTGTGGFTIANGTVSTASTSGLGGATQAITLGSAGNNATLNFSSTAGGTQSGQSITLATGSGTRAITSTSSGTSTLNAPIALGSNTLTSYATVTTGNLRYVGIISGTGGVTADALNVGTVDLRGANTFSGNVQINAGTLTAQTSSSVGTVGAITSGALGAGAVVLGSSGSATSATLGFGNSNTFLNALTVASGGTRTITQTSASSTAGTYSGPITLNGDLTLTAAATTLTTGADRLRVGSGGITGANNIIINNANTATGAVASSGAIRLDGGAAATAWTGSLIVAAGQGSLGTNTAIGASNAVDVASGATFNFSGNGALSPTIAGLNNATGAGAVGGTTGGTVTNSNGGRALTLGGSGAYTFAGTIVDSAAGTSALTVNLGAATASQTLTGASTYTGATTVSNGTLLVNGSTAAGSAVSVTGGTLGGNGTVAGTVTVSAGANLTPGATASPASTALFHTGALTLNSTSNFNVDLNNTTAGTGYDQVITSGAVSLDGSILNVTAAAGLNTGDTFFILDNGSASAITGAFANLANGDSFTSGGVAFTINYFDTGDSTAGNDISLTVTAVPEPATVLSGLLLVGALGWRQRRSLGALLAQASCE